MKVNMNTVEDRATVLATGVSFRGRTISIYNDHPSVHNARDPSQVEKVTIQDLPLYVDNRDIEALIKFFPGVKLIGGNTIWDWQRSRWKIVKF